MKEIGENTKLYVEFLLNSFVAYSTQYSKPKEDDFEEIYYHIYNTIYRAENLTSNEKLKYFNDLKDIQKIYL